MKKIIFLSTFLILVILTSFSFSEEKFYPCYRLTKEPVLDGKVRDDPAWKDIPAATDFIRLGTVSLASKQTFFKIGYTPEALYIGVECEEPDMEKIVAECKDGGSIWAEDSIEIFIFPEARDNYYQFMISAIGSRRHKTRTRLGHPGPKIALAGWTVSAYKGKDYWSVEVKLPLGILEKAPEKGQEWRGNICRNILTSGAEDRYTTWGYLKSRFLEPENFGKIIFVNEFSIKEAKEVKEIIINFMKKEIAVNLKLVFGYKKEISERIEKYPSLQKEIFSFLKNYEEIEKGIFQLGTIEEANLLFKKSENLSKKADELRHTIFLKDFF